MTEMMMRYVENLNFNSTASTCLLRTQYWQVPRNIFARRALGGGLQASRTSTMFVSTLEDVCATSTGTFTKRFLNGHLVLSEISMVIKSPIWALSLLSKMPPWSYRRCCQRLSDP